MKRNRVPFSADPDEGIYKAGLARGQTNIRTDTMTFRWRDEVYELPIGEAVLLAQYNGYWYQAKVKALRKFARKRALEKHCG